ncbi:glycosyltransferase [Nitrospira sp. NS4]|uniref:glycosyltransferase n=1 Tax=Nitrospira sp. NS4 TaxID=3414498 RepID=UPI003C2EE8D2
MHVLHVCKFRAAGASRVQMQLKWDRGSVMDVDSEPPARQQRYPLSYRSLFALLRKRHFSAVVFHMQSSVPYILFALMVRFLLRSRVVFVYDIHDLNEWPSAAAAYMRFRFCVFWVLERIAIRRADKVVTVSRGLAQIYYRRYGRSLIVVYNAPAIHADSSGSPAGSRAGLVYFGLINKLRLPRHVINAIAEAGMTVDVYGVMFEKDPEYLVWLNEKVKDGCVRLMGPYSPNNLEFLSDYSFALLVFEEGELNVRYCLPNKLFQAILQGLPCILSHGLVESRIKFKRFPEFVSTWPANKKELAGFFALPRSLRSHMDVLEFVGALHEKSCQRYMHCLLGGV